MNEIKRLQQLAGINEIKVNKPNNLNIEFVKNNIKELLNLVNSSYGVNPDGNLQVKESTVEGYPVIYIEDEDGDCELVVFFDYNHVFEGEDGWEGPISSPKNYEYKGVKFRSFSQGC